MALIRRLMAATNARSPFDDWWYRPVSSGTPTHTGLAVDHDTALKVSAVWACVRLLSESVASLPLIVYRRRPDGGKERATQHPVYDLLHTQPNVYQTAYQFVAQQMVALLLRGNAYARIIPGPRGPVDQLLPISPDAVRVEQNADATLRYLVRQKDGTERAFLDDEIWHITGMSLDGIRGVSTITYARESIGLALATEGYGARFFGNDSRPGGVLEHPGKLSKEGRANLSASWEAAHRGISNAHKVAVLEEGTTWKTVGISPEDSQYLMTREFQVTDLARWFNVPLHMIQETSKTTSWGSGIEQLSQAFVTYSLMPWLRRWEQAILKDIIVRSDVYFSEFLVDALLRGDTTTRYGAYATGRQNGWLSIDDVRGKENMNPAGVPGAKDYHVQVNLVPVDQLRQMALPTDPPGPRPGQKPPAEQVAVLERYVYDAAARVVRKETAAIGKIAKRYASDTDGYRNAVDEFYNEHWHFVAEAMRVSRGDAVWYCTDQLRAVKNGLINVIADFEPASVERLASMALGTHGINVSNEWPTLEELKQEYGAQ